jgi:hypothetical protein
MTPLLPPRESLVSDILAGDGNIEKLFLRCTIQYLLILGSMWFFCSRLLMVTGREAELDAVPKAVTSALPMFATNLTQHFF